MSIPVFLVFDTNVYDGQNYNFKSKIYNAFFDAIKEKDITLLLPVVIDLEVKRHIKERSKKAEDDILKIEGRYSPIKSWTKWPKKRGILDSWSYEIERLGLNELQEFYSKFKTVLLDYKDVDLEEIMNWYNSKKSPFGEGSKRKEFPDAIAVYCVARYAKINEVVVAFISSDKGIIDACREYSDLLSFDSLEKYIEATLNGDSRMGLFREEIDNNEDYIMQCVCESFIELSFFIESPIDTDPDDIEISGIDFPEISIVAIGDKECTIVIKGSISFDLRFSYNKTYVVGDSRFVVATTKVTFEDDGSLCEVSKIEFDEELITVDLSSI